MALTTLSTVSGTKREPVGRLFEVERLVTFGTGYATGGIPVPARSFGLNRIVKASAPRILAGFSASFAHVDTLRQTDGSIKLRMRAAAGTEVPDATDVTGVTAVVVVRGY